MYLIASWGSSGAGKTAVTLSVAAELAKRKYEVLVISTDSRTPSLPVFLPTKQLTANESIAEMLSKNEVKEGQLKGRLHEHPHSKHIYFAGVASGENATLSYGPPRREALMGLLQILQRAPFDFVIIDCDSNPVLDVTSMIALEWAQFGICTLTPDVKGYEYLKAQTTWLQNSETFRLDNFVKVLNFVHPTTPIDEAVDIIGDVQYLLPFTLDVQDKMCAGELLSGFRKMPGVEFERVISAITDKLEEVTIHA